MRRASLVWALAYGSERHKPDVTGAAGMTGARPAEVRVFDERHHYYSRSAGELKGTISQMVGFSSLLISSLNTSSFVLQVITFSPSEETKLAC